jgi:hypothetical protein
VSRRCQGGELHQSPPGGDELRISTDATSGESFAWSSHLSVAQVPQGARSVSSSDANPRVIPRTNRRGRVIEWLSGARRTFSSDAGGPVRRKIAVFFSPRIGRSRGSARTSNSLQKLVGGVSVPNKLSERAAKTAADGSERGPSRSDHGEQSSGHGRRRDSSGSRGGGQRPSSSS